jgi:uncharacterized protein
MQRKKALIASVFLALSLGGCSVARTMMSPKCYTQRVVLTPELSKVLSVINTGQSGRELTEAVFNGDYERVKTMLKNDPQLAKTEALYDRVNGPEVDRQYGDLLTFAVGQCDLEMINVLLDAGIPADGIQRGTALGTALLADEPIMAELLLRRGASPDPQKQPNGENVFKMVKGYGHAGAVMMLLRHGLDVNYKDEWGETHLHEAASTLQFPIMNLLVEKGANPWVINSTGSMPIQEYAAVLSKGDTSSAEAKIALRLKADAEAKGLPWPPPSYQDTRVMVLKGEWPTPAAIKAGVVPPSPTALAQMKIVQKNWDAR